VEVEVRPLEITIEHEELVKLAEKWLRGRGCGVVLTELHTHASERPDAIGFRSGYSIVVECKTSWADFAADAQKVIRLLPYEGMGSYRFYLCPAGLIDVSDLPENWGLIWVNEEGKARMVRGPKGNIWGQAFSFEKNMKAEQLMLVSALRRRVSEAGSDMAGINTNEEDENGNSSDERGRSLRG